LLLLRLGEPPLFMQFRVARLILDRAQDRIKIFGIVVGALD
jgi:hypothetical protein